MYPAEVKIKDNTESITSASYLYSLLSIGRDGQLLKQEYLVERLQSSFRTGILFSNMKSPSHEC